MKKSFIYVLLALLPALLFSGCTVKVEQPEVLEDALSESTQAAESSTMAPSAKTVAGIEDLSVEKIIWGPGNIQNHEQPAEPKKLQQEYAQLNAQWLLSDEKSIALTFDEGYENGYTPAILDTLKDKEVKAIFFVTYDFAKDNPDLIQRMLDEGHVVGNHSYHHYSMDELDTDTAKEEVTFLHNYIKDNYDYEMQYFRFPKGEFSEKTLGIVQELGYQSVFWSYAYADWNPDEQPEAATAFAKICESTHPGEIMLLHAVSATNADILGKVIDDVRQQGYTFTTAIA